MCGRYSLTNTDQLPLRFDVAEPVSISADPNVAPTQELPVIVESDGTRHVVRMRWGLIPHWSKGSGGEHYTMINARAETVATKPAYRVPFLRRRCLVPANGFFEYGRLPSLHARQQPSRQRPSAAAAARFLAAGGTCCAGAEQCEHRAL